MIKDNYNKKFLDYYFIEQITPGVYRVKSDLCLRDLGIKGVEISQREFFIEGNDYDVVIENYDSFSDILFKTEYQLLDYETDTAKVRRILECLNDRSNIFGAIIASFNQDQLKNDA